MDSHPLPRNKVENAYDVTLSMKTFEKGKTIIDAKEMVSAIKRHLSPKLKDPAVPGDMASQGPEAGQPAYDGRGPDPCVQSFDPQKWRKSR